MISQVCDGEKDGRILTSLSSLLLSCTSPHFLSVHSDIPTPTTLCDSRLYALSTIVEVWNNYRQFFLSDMVVLSTLQPWLSCAMTHNMLFRTFGLLLCSLFLSQAYRPTISEGISALPERPQTIALLQFSWKAFLHSYTHCTCVKNECLRKKFKHTQHPTSTSFEGYRCLKWPSVNLSKGSCLVLLCDTLKKCLQTISEAWHHLRQVGRRRKFKYAIRSAGHTWPFSQSTGWARPWECAESVAAHMSKCADGGKDETTNQS